MTPTNSTAKSTTKSLQNREKGIAKSSLLEEGRGKIIKECREIFIYCCELT